MGIKIFFMLPSKGRFLNTFANDQLKAQANHLWQSLDHWALPLLILAIVIGILGAFIYYKPFNELPGRHYSVKYWGSFLIYSVLVAFAATLGIEYFAIGTHLSAKYVMPLFWTCAINNALYTAAIYFITSWIWCNFLPTNAYKFLKPRS